MTARVRIAAIVLATCLAAMSTARAAPPDADVALPAAASVSYEDALRALHDELGRRYPAFDLKGIDWDEVGAELLPRAATVTDDAAFGLLCMELVARLEDSHAALLDGTAARPVPPGPRYDPGFACLEDDRGEPVVYHVDPGSPAARAGLRPGVTIVAIDGRPVRAAIDETMALLRRYAGFSSERALHYQAFRRFARRVERNAWVFVTTRDLDGIERTHRLAATLDRRSIPRLPVPKRGIGESANVSWTMLAEEIGYIYVRRIRADLVPRLDRAVADLAHARGLVIDVRGNSGGGFDMNEALLNFDLTRDDVAPQRPRFRGPIAVLVDARCVSAGEGWASWFVATGRAQLFGGATTGASARKTEYTIPGGLYRVRFPVKLYRGFLDRPIERRGLEPDVPVRCRASDLAAGRDTVLETARDALLAGGR